MLKWLESKREKNLRNGIQTMNADILKLLQDNHELNRQNERLIIINQELIDANAALTKLNDTLKSANKLL